MPTRSGALTCCSSRRRIDLVQGWHGSVLWIDPSQRSNQYVVRRIDGQPGTWIDPHIWKYSADVRTSESPLPRGRVTLPDVAAQAGVSKSLASLVIRDAPGPSVASREA